MTTIEYELLREFRKLSQDGKREVNNEMACERDFTEIA